MDTWKTLLPRIKKMLTINSKKKAAAEATKSFDASKESLDKEIQEKQDELAPKVVEILKPLDANTKKAVKEPTPAAIKNNSKALHKLLEELGKIGFPGAKDLSEEVTKYGMTLLYGPVTYELEKVSKFLPEEEEQEAKVEEPKEVAAAERELEITAETTSPKKEASKTEETSALATAGETKTVVAEQASKEEAKPSEKEGETAKVEEKAEPPKKTAPEPAKTEPTATATTEPAKDVQEGGKP